jgi:hypothetical protein
VLSLRRIESFLEGVMEGSFGRLFRSPLQPSEVAKKLERAMEENYVVAIDGVIVPNVYDVVLHPQDLAPLSATQGGLERQMEQWLHEVAREERYRFVGPVQVRLASDGGVPRRTVRIQGAIVDAAADEETTRASDVYTRDYRVIRTAEGGPACRLKLLSGPQAGHVFIIGGKTATIGRSLDNDVVIDSSDVSRRHARLEQTPGGYRLIDLDSTNGTHVNGQRSTQQLLTTGDTIRLGNTELIFQLSETSDELPRGTRPRDRA